MPDQVLPIDPAVALAEGASWIERMAAGERAAREASVDRLGRGMLAGIDWNWPLCARVGQLPPKGDWRTWLIMAGRGFGKTRAGAEWAIPRRGRGHRATRAASSWWRWAATALVM